MNSANNLLTDDIGVVVLGTAGQYLVETDSRGLLKSGEDVRLRVKDDCNHRMSEGRFPNRTAGALPPK